MPPTLQVFAVQNAVAPASYLVGVIFFIGELPCTTTTQETQLSHCAARETKLAK
jgi:hypothetical protein